MKTLIVYYSRTGITKKLGTEIANLLKASLPKGFQAGNSAPAKKAVLPAHCPSCGAAVRPDEVEWLDDITAECDYCGSPVRGE